MPVICFYICLSIPKSMMDGLYAYGIPHSTPILRKHTYNSPPWLIGYSQQKKEFYFRCQSDHQLLRIYSFTLPKLIMRKSSSFQVPQGNFTKYSSTQSHLTIVTVLIQCFLRIEIRV